MSREIAVQSAVGQVGGAQAKTSVTAGSIKRFGMTQTPVTPEIEESTTNLGDLFSAATNPSLPQATVAKEAWTLSRDGCTEIQPSSSCSKARTWSGASAADFQVPSHRCSSELVGADERVGQCLERGKACCTPSLTPFLKSSHMLASGSLMTLRRASSRNRRKGWPDDMDAKAARSSTSMHHRHLEETDLPLPESEGTECSRIARQMQVSSTGQSRRGGTSTSGGET